MKEETYIKKYNERIERLIEHLQDREDFQKYPPYKTYCLDIKNILKTFLKDQENDEIKERELYFERCENIIRLIHLEKKKLEMKIGRKINDIFNSNIVNVTVSNMYNIINNSKVKLYRITKNGKKRLIDEL